MTEQDTALAARLHAQADIITGGNYDGFYSTTIVLLREAAERLRGLTQELDDERRLCIRAQCDLAMWKKSAEGKQRHINNIEAELLRLRGLTAPPAVRLGDALAELEKQVSSLPSLGRDDTGMNFLISRADVLHAISRLRQRETPDVPTTIRQQLDKFAQHAAERLRGLTAPRFTSEQVQIMINTVAWNPNDAHLADLCGMLEAYRDTLPATTPETETP